MALSENPTLEEIINEIERLNNLIVSRGGSQIITPKTTNQTLNKGYYKGDITVKGDANLASANIVSGKSIFGIAGSATIQSLGGKRWAKGTTSKTKSVRGLPFQPRTVIYWFTRSTYGGGMIGIYSADAGINISSRYQNNDGSNGLAYPSSANVTIYNDGFDINIGVLIGGADPSFVLSLKWMAIE